MADGIIDSRDMSLSKLSEIVKDRGNSGVLQSMVWKRLGHDQAAEQQQNVLLNYFY